MKRIATTALAALMMVGPLAGAASAQQWRGNDSHNARNDNRNDRRDNRNDRRDTRWDQSRYNGYYANGRYYRGEPSAAMRQRGDYRPAYQSWRRGERLPSYYRSQFREVDWRRQHLRQPPRGYHYVRDSHTGETLLVAVTTGVILSILLSQ